MGGHSKQRRTTAGILKAIDKRLKIYSRIVVRGVERYSGVERAGLNLTLGKLHDSWCLCFLICKIQLILESIAGLLEGRLNA